MIIVGVGVGPNMLTQEAIAAIRSAPVIYGSGRSIELVKDFINCEAHIIKNYRELHLLPADAVVLSTGDPMFSGLGKFADENDKSDHRSFLNPGFMRPFSCRDVSSCHYHCTRT